MKVYIECLYCGYKWEEYVYNEDSLVGKRCNKCNDRRIKAKLEKGGVVDYYKGSPQFEKKELEIEDGWPYNQMMGGID